MVRVDDEILWECLNDKNVTNIASDLGCKEKVDYTKLDDLCSEQNNILLKHGLDSSGCYFDREMLGEDDYNEYNRLEGEKMRRIRELKKEYIDNCIDWLMENGYKIKVVRELGI